MRRELNPKPYSQTQNFNPSAETPNTKTNLKCNTPIPNTTAEPQQHKTATHEHNRTPEHQNINLQLQRSMVSSRNRRGAYRDRGVQWSGTFLSSFRMAQLPFQIVSTFSPSTIRPLGPIGPSFCPCQRPHSAQSPFLWPLGHDPRPVTSSFHRSMGSSNTRTLEPPTSRTLNPSASQP